MVRRYRQYAVFMYQDIGISDKTGGQGWTKEIGDKVV
mgnify:FL=1